MPIGNRRKCEEILRTRGNRIFLDAHNEGGRRRYGVARQEKRLRKYGNSSNIFPIYRERYFRNTDIAV